MQTLIRQPESIREKAEVFARGGNSKHHEIQIAAYLKAEQRGFSPGHELDDWLEAERDFNNPVSS